MTPINEIIKKNMKNTCVIRLTRDFKLPAYTIGKMYINGKYFCDTLEDADRGLRQSMPLNEIRMIKVPGETAIPTGMYKVDMNTVSPKYKDREAYQFCGGKLPRLLDVPGYEGVLIHIGNSAKDTEGCILVGENKAKGQVLNSTATFRNLYQTLQGNDHIIIEIS